MLGSRDESLPVVAWLVLREVGVRALAARENYRRAGQVCQQLAGEEDALIASPYDRARWKLYRTYTTYLLRHTAAASPSRFTEDAASHSLSALEASLQPLLVNAGYGWQWFLLKILLWLERRFAEPIHFLAQLDAYAHRHLAGQTERGTCFYRQLRARVVQRNSRRETISTSSDGHWPVASGRDILQEIVPYERLQAAMIGSS